MINMYHATYQNTLEAFREAMERLPDVDIENIDRYELQALKRFCQAVIGAQDECKEALEFIKDVTK